ncbi:SNF1-related protein kinase regulatory subunit beta-2-like isoform X2 [Vicia villosa]|nr:SNF1-related protein kinase regulatory subunit beta-2-like isoform X2 [Vicia villosa]
MMSQAESPQRWMHNTYAETVVHESLQSARIIWNYGGSNVAIAGSWDNWKTIEALENVGEGFEIIKTLPIRIYHYLFYVDGIWTYAPEFPSYHDNLGYAYNILDLQNYIAPRMHESEYPSSPPSSYDNILLNEDDFNKPPPELPPQLRAIIADEYASTSNAGPVSVPTLTHVNLNHLYVYKSDDEQFAALRSTQRLQQKFVTKVMYREKFL